MRVSFIAFILATLFAQAKTPLKFDVASVRPNTSDDHIVTIDPGPGGRFAARGYTLKLLIQQAYDVKGFQISGGAGWMETDLYNIEARGPGTATRAQLNEMLQSLLQERFALKIHRIHKELPGFALTVAGDRAKLKPSTATQDNPTMSHRKGAALVADGISMVSFAKDLGAYLSKPVVDATGLTGLYDFKILWTERADQLPDAAAKPDVTGGLSLPSALKEQLGLKLTAKKIDAEVLVVDSAEKPTPN